MPIVKRTLETLEIVGGALCLDFANTVNSRLEPEHDYLLTYPDLTAWAKKLGILQDAQESILVKRANQQKADAELVAQAARAQRETIYRVFSRLARQEEPRSNDLDTLLHAWGKALRHGKVIKKEESYEPDWQVDQELDALQYPIIHSAAQLLFSEDHRKIKECPGCGWLFVDTSKNQSRRWCSMNTCGVSDKMRRYYRKSQQK